MASILPYPKECVPPIHDRFRCPTRRLVPRICLLVYGGVAFNAEQFQVTEIPPVRQMRHLYRFQRGNTSLLAYDPCVPLQLYHNSLLAYDPCVPLQLYRAACRTINDVTALHLPMNLYSR
jgi:hypothetical protein